MESGDYFDLVEVLQHIEDFIISTVGFGSWIGSNKTSSSPGGELLCCCSRCDSVRVVTPLQNRLESLEVSTFFFLLDLQQQGKSQDHTNTRIRTDDGSDCSNCN
jgi:hypothetical protein